MAFSDIAYLVILAFAFVVILLTMDYIWTAVIGVIGPDMPGNTSQSMNASWTQNKQFADDSFTAIWFLLAAVSIGLTIFLGSHPIVLVAWIFFNFVILFVVDSLTDFLTAFLASDMNTGSMNDAASFVQTDMPKAIVGVNILLGIIMFGKRAVVG